MTVGNLDRLARDGRDLSSSLPCLIDANVEDTQLNVEAAHGEILKYFQSVTSNRWLMVKIFLILIIFFVVFVVFLA
ncbi:STX5 protein, partial [Atractosteus spatula]|nr:STX5 protein [Atractosteus spatula]